MAGAPVPTLDTIASGIVTLADHELAAAKKLGANAYAYIFGGAGDEITLRGNRSAWDAIQLLPRVLRDMTGGHTRGTLLQRSLAHPILLAPTAFHRLAHPDGETATALAAAAQGAGLVLSAQSTIRLEDIARLIIHDPERGPLWFQLYMMPDREFTQQLVRRAEAAGYEAIVLTVDASSSGARDRERRANVKIPDTLSAVNLVGMVTPAAPQLQPGQSAMFDALLASAPRWSDIAWLRSITSLPIIVKGILHPDDARLAVDAGVAAVIVSNHGGRTLDTVPPTAQVLPDIVAAVAQRVPVLVDGGIRRGTDVLKAIALGATAVLVGRPALCGLANAGAMGVAHVIRLLRDELEIAMALTGCRTLADANAQLLYQPLGATPRIS